MTGNDRHDDADLVAEVCPTGAIQAAADGRLFLDRGRCILCGGCVAARPELFAWAPGAATAALSRAALVVPETAESDAELAALRDALASRVRRLRRSVHIRHVDAGSDGAEEWEVAALFNPVYDAHRLGIFLTASPRHADILLVTGAGARGMTEPLARTLEAMPRPLIVIAAGTDAIGGGLVAGSYATHAGVADLLPVDVWVPGNPAQPVQPAAWHPARARPDPHRHPGRWAARKREVAMTGLLAAALAVLAVAAVLDLLPAVRRRAGWVPFALCGLAAVGLAVVGGGGLAGHAARLGLDGWVPFDAAALTTDRLSSLFLLLAFAVAAPVCAVVADWAADGANLPSRGLGAAVALLLGAVTLIVTADHVFTFLFGWESLTLAFYLITAYRRRPATVTGSLLTLVFGKASGQLAMLGLLLAAAHAGTFHLAGLAGLPAGTARSFVYVLLVAGFGVKIGLVPGQIWMPAGYAAAPGPVRALLAGAAVNVGFYGLWRTAALLGAPPAWLPVVLLIVGGLTALGGIAHATVSERLTRVIAYSSIENTGLIIVGYAIALIGLDQHQPTLTAVGILAASLQMVAHAIAKSALFTAAGVIGSAYGTDDMEILRGVARRMPYSGTALAIGSVTLAGLPPTIGFVSEWFLLEAIAQQFRLAALPTQIAMALVGALVALTAGFAGVAFVRVIAFTVLGHTGTPPFSRAPRDAGIAGRAGLLVLAGGCLAVAAVAPLQVRTLAAGLAPVVPTAVTLGALKSPWVLQPVLSGLLDPLPVLVVDHDADPVHHHRPRCAAAVARSRAARSGGYRPGVRPPPVFRAPTSTRRSATRTPPARSSPRCCSPATACGRSRPSLAAAPGTRPAAPRASISATPPTSSRSSRLTCTGPCSAPPCSPPGWPSDCNPAGWTPTSPTCFSP